MDDVVGPAGNTVGRNGMIAADYYMKRLGIVSIGFEPWFKPAASALHRHKLLNTTEHNIDYARPWEPMDLDADDVVGALQERLLWYWCLAR